MISSIGSLENFSCEIHICLFFNSSYHSRAHTCLAVTYDGEKHTVLFLIKIAVKSRQQLKMSTFTKQVLKKIDIKIKCFFLFFYMKHNPVFRLLDKAAFLKKILLFLVVLKILAQQKTVYAYF